MASDESELGSKERLQILLAEYGSLRSEQVNRAGSAYILVGFAIAGTAAVATQEAWWALPLLATALGFVAWVIVTDVQRANDRVCELEALINASIGEELLVWQTRGGGLFGRGWRHLFRNHISD